MDFDLSETQQLFRATVERFCGPVDIAARKVRRAQPGGLDRARWGELAELGLIGVAAAETDGGMGGSLADCAVIARALGEGLASEPWLECAYLPARLLAGRAELSGVLSGETIAALAFAEPGRRYRLDARDVRAEGGTLRGTKTFVPCGGAAELFVVSAATANGPALFAVAAEAPGVTVRPYAVADGSIAAELVLDGAVTGDPLTADFAAVIDEARILAAAEMTGLAQRLLADTLDYVKTREQFGQPIGRFQVIQHRLVDCYAKVEAMQSALYRALLVGDLPAVAVKGFVAEEAIWLGQQAVQLHGGMGMTDELAVGHALKRILLLARLFGDPAAGMAALGRQAA